MSTTHERSFRPTSRLGWSAFWLGLVSLAWTLAMPWLYDLFGALLAAATRQPLLIPMAYALTIIDLALALAALVVGLVALRKGERSWMSLLALLPAAGRLVIAVLSLLGRRAFQGLVVPTTLPLTICPYEVIP